MINLLPVPEEAWQITAITQSVQNMNDILRVNNMCGLLTINTEIKN
jgi:hypothetical protein